MRNFYKKIKKYLLLLLILLKIPNLFAIGKYSLIFKINNFGYRIEDPKVCICTQNPGDIIQIKKTYNDTLVYTITNISFYGYDADSGDNCWMADFSSFKIPGEYYLYIPSLNFRSYNFWIKNNIYTTVGEIAMKSFYYQRCNYSKEEPYAGYWCDSECHLHDYTCTHNTNDGTPDYGILDLHGGWHDAGDYQKTPAWNRGVEHLLWAYEKNKEKWYDNQLNIPESGNGIPDILDEISWELDFYVRMQLPDGHFLSTVKKDSTPTTCVSPPSCSDEKRFYSDDRPLLATGWCVLTLSHAAIIYKELNETQKAFMYEKAATNGWFWLTNQNPTGDAKDLKCAAASAVFIQMVIPLLKII
ncbi:MAG: glycoside hydrolase family 9 protein [Promethearchaeota archaeon]